VNTQQKVDEVLPTVHDMTPTDFIRNMELKKALYKLHGEIIFHEVRCGAADHPRVMRMASTKT
jgi:hypothetical protein